MSEELDKEYDNFMHTSTEENVLFEVAEDPVTKSWKGMPSFSNEKNEAHKTINVRFRCKEDYDKFAELLSVSLTDKTKSMWYPPLGKNENTLFNWSEDDVQ